MKMKVSMNKYIRKQKKRKMTRKKNDRKKYFFKNYLK